MEGTISLNNLAGLRETLLHNGVYLGIALVLTLLIAQVLLRGVQRLSGLLLRSSALQITTEQQEGWQRKIRRMARLLTGLLVLGLIGAAGLASWRRVRLGDFLREQLGHMQRTDWLGVGFAGLKTLGILGLALLLSRLVRVVLQFLSDRLQRASSLASRRERLTKLLVRLRLLLSCVLLFAALLVCARLLSVPDGASRFIWSAAYLCTAVYAGRFAVGAAHLVIDVVFDLSDTLSPLESPLRYLGRFRHLSNLTKRTADYFIYIGLATWTMDHLNPGTWASHVGRLAIRIIAIFYISRVLVEICILFMNEYFLNRARPGVGPAARRTGASPLPAAGPR